MTGAERVPLTGAEMDQWSAGAADPLTTAVAGVAAGLGPEWAAKENFVDWTAPTGAVPPVDPLLDARLRETWHPEQSARQIPPPLRLAVRGSLLPREVIPRLLAAPAVGSAILPVPRPPGALMRREWSWPLRIGVADDQLLAALNGLKDSWILPGRLVDLSDVRSTPGAVNLLVLRSSPSEAAAFVVGNRQVSNAVVCIADSAESWPVVDAHFALVRAASAAVLTALTPKVAPEDAAARVLHIVRYLSHAHRLDVALTAAFDRRILIAAELAAIENVTLPEMFRERASRARREGRELARMAEPPSPSAPPDDLEPPMAGSGPPPLMGFDAGAVESAAEALDALAEGSFDSEGREATHALDFQEPMDAALEEAAAVVPRLLQAFIGPPDAPTPDNILRAGVNAVDVFVGPREERALHGLTVPDAAIGFDDPALASARLTVVLAPLVPDGPAVRAELDVPRFGRSPDVRLAWTLPERGLVQARLLIIHRNRVLQTVRITGRVGSAARMTDRIVLWDQMGRLDERQPFDRTFVVNHDARGRARMVSHADGATTIQPMAEIDAATERIRVHLIAATQLRSKGAKAAEDIRQILIDVAVEGNEVYGLLEDHLERFIDAQRIQIITARSGRLLPLEFVYHRQAPDPGATVCANWTAGRACGEHCFADEDDISIVCPSVFWGMSRFIERQVASLTDSDGNAFIVKASPTRSRRTLTVTRPLLGASRKVRAADVGKTVASLGQARTATTWTEWVTQLKDTPTDLLVLMPHTDPAVVTLEISGVTLRRGNIEARHVTGAHDVHPVLVLLGCDTAGSDQDPAGYANRFMAKGAAVVFSTLTMLLAGHAATMSQRLAEKLHDPARKAASLGQFVTEFRRDAVRAGLISALAVTAYGDADWSL